MKKIYVSALFRALVMFLFVFIIPVTQAATAAESKTAARSQSVGEYFDDSVITTVVKSKIAAEKGLPALNIGVATRGGVVTLSGRTDTAEHAQLAERIARQVNGVKRVANNLQADDSVQTTVEYIEDSAITAAVKANILKEKGLSSLDISVKTHNGIVILSGVTDSAENWRRAELAAREAKGVKYVVNNLKIQ